MIKAFKFNSRFIKKEEIGKDIFSFFFEKPAGFKYKPGQYVRVTLDLKNPDSRGSSRYFTLSSNPKEEHLVITTKIVKSSFKKELSNFKVDQTVKMFGPIGYFDFDEKKNQDSLFLSGGMGITPFRSILFSTKNKITLIASFDKSENAIYFHELNKRKNDKQRIIFTLTKENREGYEKGRISKAMIEKYAKDFKKNKIFIVGPEVMVSEIYETVKLMGAKEENIFKEDFTGY